MKKLTYSSMAAARLRANKRQYVSLVLGIFLAIFLVTTLFLAVQGFLLAQVAKTENRVGKLDAFMLDLPEITDDQMMELGYFTDIGHVYVTAQLNESDTYIGYYDERAAKHLNRQLRDGHMPEEPGQIAVEYNTLLSMNMEREWKIGDAVTLSVQPIDGVTEERTYTLVGVLDNQVSFLEPEYHIHSAHVFVDKFPAILISDNEPDFSTGRVAVHRTFLADGGKLAVPYCNKILDKFNYRTMGNFYALSVSGRVLSNDEPVLGVAYDESVGVPLMLGLLLGAALMVSCCVGIAGAMDGALARRSEEIGLLRAVGATKKQIRRIFGRESLLLAAIVAPASVLLGIGTVGLLARIVPEQMVLKIQPMLLIPILIISVVMILVAGYFPLRRYSALMPMSVLRDTAVLRKIKHIRSRKHFKAQNLISARLVQLYPSRQIGSGILAVLMLFCAACAAFVISMGAPVLHQESPAFEILIDNATSSEYMDYLPNKPISAQSIAQLRKLPRVKNITIERKIDMLVLLEERSLYLARENPSFYTQEEYLERAIKNWGDLWHDGRQDAAIEEYQEGLQRYNDLREFLNVEQELVKLAVETVVLDAQTIAKYAQYVESGKINIDAINAGREVIVVAPKVWSGVNEDGFTYNYFGPERSNENEVLVGENDCFYAGQTLPMIQFYSEAKEYYPYHYPEAEAQRRDATVTVGAVLSEFSTSFWSTAVIATTEEGLQNMGFYANGYDTYNIFLDGEIDGETEAMLLEHIEAVAARSGEYRLYNYLERYRENVQTREQLIVVFMAITILFATVSVSMIVSSITRRIQSDGRRIGMLRAVGADEKTILGCYTGQVTVSIAGGFLVTVALFALIILTDFAEGLEPYIPQGLGTMIALALLSWGACRYVLRLRIRSIVNKSIIDNIREL